MSPPSSIAQAADRFGWAAHALSREHLRALMDAARRIESVPPSRPLAGRHLAIATPVPQDPLVQRLRDDAQTLGARVSLIPVPCMGDRSSPGSEETCRVLSRLYDLLIVPDASLDWLAWVAERCPIPVLGDLVSAASPAWLAACALAIESCAHCAPDTSCGPVAELVLDDHLDASLRSAWQVVAPVLGLDLRPEAPQALQAVRCTRWHLDVDAQGQPVLEARHAGGTPEAVPGHLLRRHHAAVREALIVDALAG